MGIFYGGVPTKPDVDKLMALEINPGTELSYAQFEQVTGEKRKTNRFRTIMDAFRHRLLRERRLQTSVYGGNIHFLVADEALDLNRRNLWRAGRAIGRTRRGVELIDNAQLTTAEKRDLHNLMKREMEALSDSIARSAKQIAAPAASTSAVLRLAKG